MHTNLFKFKSSINSLNFPKFSALKKPPIKKYIEFQILELNFKIHFNISNSYRKKPIEMRLAMNTF